MPATKHPQACALAHLHELLQEARERRSLRDIAIASKIGYSALARFADAPTTDLRISTVDALASTLGYQLVLVPAKSRRKTKRPS